MATTVLEAGKITEEGLQKLRARIGSMNRPRQYGIGQYNEYAGRDAIRHFCQGIGDGNPLYWDEEYARKTRYGTIVAPPTFLYSAYWCSGRVGGLPGVHGFHAGNDWEFFRPIYVNDRITIEEQFTDVQDKKSEFAGRIIITSSVCTYRNQRGEKLARTRGWQVRAERTAAKEHKKYQIETTKFTAAELMAIEESILGEKPRGADPRWFEDVQVGEDVTPMVKGPLTIGDITAFVAGTFGGLAHGLQVKEMRRHPSWGFINPETGAREAVVRVHDIEEAAQDAGIPGLYDYGMQRCCWMGHMLTNWMGDQGFLRRLYVELRRFNYVGDVTWCEGTVTGKRVEDGEHLVDIKLIGRNQRKEEAVKGTAVVRLPSRVADSTV